MKTVYKITIQDKEYLFDTRKEAETFKKTKNTLLPLLPTDRKDFELLQEHLSSILAKDGGKGSDYKKLHTIGYRVSEKCCDHYAWAAGQPPKIIEVHMYENAGEASV